MRRRIAGITDTAVRVSYLRTTLLALATEDALTLLSAMTAAAQVRDAATTDLLLATSVALAHESCRALRTSITTLAREQNLADVSRFFAPSSETSPDPSSETNLPNLGKGRPLSLGERKSLARTHNRDLIARVLRDPSADVMRILLGNPRITEDDVVRLCARRPQSGRVLMEVFRHTRWVTRYRVRTALVRNPYTPLEIALQLVPHLTSQDARMVAQSQDLDTTLRDACACSSVAPTLH
ncbi:MAG: hypothetical protein IPK60_24175 [Sandaracinaceae bacterium]|nr:hypothetical protein [Sandaracinaceae bacterium]